MKAAHSVARRMLAGRKSREEALEAMLCPHSAANECRTQSRAEGILPGGNNLVLGLEKYLANTVSEDKK
jgi:hypothetical protein